MRKIFNKIANLIQKNELLNNISTAIVHVVNTIIDFYKEPEEESCIVYAEGRNTGNNGGYAVGHKPKDSFHNDVHLTVDKLHIDGKSEILEYNIKNQLIHSKRSDGYERWFVYDSKGRLTYYKTSANFESWRTYDEKGNCITYKNSRGHYNKFIYDDRGIVVDMIDITD